jgi:hypothetical protein
MVGRSRLLGSLRMRCPKHAVKKIVHLRVGDDGHLVGFGVPDDESDLPISSSSPCSTGGSWARKRMQWLAKRRAGLEGRSADVQGLVSAWQSIICIS